MCVIGQRIVSNKLVCTKNIKGGGTLQDLNDVSNMASLVIFRFNIVF